MKITFMRTSFHTYHFSVLCLVLIMVVGGVVFSLHVSDYSSNFVYGQNNESQSTGGDLNDDDDNNDSDKDTSNTNKDIPCNTVAVLGPAYIGPEGCPLPCPEDPSDEIPDECPQPESNSKLPFGDKEIEQVSAQDDDNNSVDRNNNEDSIRSEVGCSAVATSDPNYVYCNKQQPIHPQQHIPPQQPPQQNTSFNARINSDTTSNIPTTETPTTNVQKSFNPAGKFKPGSGQTELSIPPSSNDPAVPYTPGAGNAERKGSSVIPNNNTDPRTPIEPGNIPTNIGDRWAHLTVYFTTTSTNTMEYCISTRVISSEFKANPHCIKTNEDTSTLHLLQAPGYLYVSVGGFIGNVGGNSDCHGYVYLKQSKSCTINIIDYDKQ
jgi:hypothetical protein